MVCSPSLPLMTRQKTFLCHFHQCVPEIIGGHKLLHVSSFYSVVASEEYVPYQQKLSDLMFCSATVLSRLFAVRVTQVT